MLYVCSKEQSKADIDEEVRQEWVKNGIDGSRTRTDDKEARISLEKKINDEEEKNKHHTF